jgi:hypothetical protein
MPKKIGEREEDLIVAIHDHVFVDREFMRNNIFRKEDGSVYSEVTIGKTLKGLQKDGYIKQFPLLKENRAGNAIRVYTLDENGVKEAQQILGESDWDSRWSQRTPTYIYHCLRVAHLQAIYAGHGGTDVIRYVDFFSERRAFRNYGQAKKAGDGKERKPSNTVIRPDGAFIMERLTAKGSGYILYFIEMERSRQRPGISMDKLRRYNEYCRKKAYQHDANWGVDIAGVRILFISDKRNERDRLMKHTETVDTSSTLGVLYGTYQDSMENPYGRIYKAKTSADPDRFYHLAEKIVQQKNCEVAN